MTVRSLFIILSTLFVVTTYSKDRQVSYYELVFPKDIHKCSFAFLEMKDNYPNLVTRAARGLINNFMHYQKLERGIEHDLVSRDYTKDDLSSHKYIIDHKLTEISYWTNNGMRISKSLTFKFIEIESNKEYRYFAFCSKNKNLEEGSYTEDDINYTKIKSYFSTLDRILKNLDKKGPERTFKKELRRQKRSGRGDIIFSVVIYGVVPVACIIAGIFLLG